MTFEGVAVISLVMAVLNTLGSLSLALITKVNVETGNANREAVGGLRSRVCDLHKRVEIVNQRVTKLEQKEND